MEIITEIAKPVSLLDIINLFGIIGFGIVSVLFVLFMPVLIAGGVIGSTPEVTGDDSDDDEATPAAQQR